MMYMELLLCYEQISRYGLRLPLLDIGGMDAPTISDYRRTTDSGDQSARYVKIECGRPFDSLAPDYRIENPEYGGVSAEVLAERAPSSCGTIVCVSVLEHVTNPFEFFSALYGLLMPGGLLVLSTLFEFPLHGDQDMWRFTPSALDYLAQRAGLSRLDGGWLTPITAEEGIKDHRGLAQIVRPVWIVASRGPLSTPDRQGPFAAPVIVPL